MSRSRTLALDALDALRTSSVIEAVRFGDRFTGSRAHEARRKHWARLLAFLRGARIPHEQAERGAVRLLPGAREALEAHLGDPLEGVDLDELDREDEAAAHDPEVLAALRAARPAEAG